MCSIYCFNSEKLIIPSTKTNLDFVVVFWEDVEKTNLLKNIQQKQQLDEKN